MKLLANHNRKYVIDKLSKVVDCKLSLSLKGPIMNDLFDKYVKIKSIIACGGNCNN